MTKPPAIWAECLVWAKRLTKAGRQWTLAILGGGTTDSTTWMRLREFYVDLGLAHTLSAPGATDVNYLEQTAFFAQQTIASMRNVCWGVAKEVGRRSRHLGQDPGGLPVHHADPPGLERIRFCPRPHDRPQDGQATIDRRRG
jgi:hypothetical protein